MKRKIYAIAKKYNVEILSYKSQRSDMGVQMFEMTLRNQNRYVWIHDDGYYVGEKNGREKIIEYFAENLIQRLTLK